jgi:hypothetical protein
MKKHVSMKIMQGVKSKKERSPRTSSEELVDLWESKEASASFNFVKRLAARVATTFFTGVIRPKCIYNF